jgi:hypothetical protein
MKYRFEYTDGTSFDLAFDNYADAHWFAQMEGDHLVKWYQL